MRPALDGVPREHRAAPWGELELRARAALVPRSRTAAAGLRVRGRRDVVLPHVTADVARRLGERLGVTVEQHPFRHASPGRGAGTAPG